MFCVYMYIYMFVYMYVDIVTQISLALMSTKPRPTSGHCGGDQGDNDHSSIFQSVFSSDGSQDVVCIL